ncbi:hypothetical protein [Mucilaginibacter gotjawali]|uniref:Uncharacterized protein n=2 Tax=Mucilaginibacter gotjawali TaxID=1550579 RepID=A0A839SKV5_9SPHI|nr:hypothetical protein [Mucilaginibacter gotjawali]MBB3058142.1 hypothetical protein [Mucilaginibacter gotjawali]BAU54903.1 hypothetical protein MgSA37_03082 [Mucilaginibacter gotjawali]
MKNKKLTYVLGLVVLVVWGMIIYRVFNGLNSDDDSVPVVSLKTAKEAFNDFSIPKDTTHLLLNYRDPFGIVKQKDTDKVGVRRVAERKIPVQVKPMDWGFIRYSGYMLNPTTKKLIALVNINGQNITLAEGQTKNDLKLIKNLRDSIKISYAGKTKFIAIKSSAL